MPMRTYEVVSRKHIVLPDLQSKFRFGFLLCLVKAPEVFLTERKLSLDFCSVLFSANVWGHWQIKEFSSVS